MLRSKAIRLHKLVVNPNPDKPTCSITDGKRIAAGSSNFQWRLSYEFETHRIFSRYGVTTRIT